MGEASGIRAGKGFLELALNDKVSREIDRVAKKLKDVGDSIIGIGKRTLGIGAAITAPLLIAAQQFASMGSQINDAAARTGLSTTAVQELGYAAEQTGASFEDVEVGIKKMQRTVFEAAAGSKSAREALAGLGLTVEQLKDLRPEAQFELLASRISDIKDPAAHTAVSLEIFGKSGTKLIPMLQELAAQTAHLHELGTIMSPADIALADKFGDTMDDVWKQIRAVTAQIGAAVAQALLPFAGTVQRILRSVIDWARENRGLVITVLATGAALIAAGTAAIALGLAIKTIGFALVGITSAFKLVSGAVLLLTNPIFLVVAALGVLTAWFLTSTQNGAALMSWLGEKFNSLKDTAMTAFGGIADALKAGDIALAAQILWTALKLAWIQGTQELQAQWSGFNAGLVKAWVDGTTNILESWAIVQAALESMWAKSASFFVESWHQAVEETTKAFDFLDRREREREKERIRRDQAAGKITAQQAEKQIANVDAQANQVLAARQRQDEQDRQRREQELRAKLDDIKAQKGRRLAELEDERKALDDAADANADQAIRDLQKEKEKLEQQLKDLRGKARDEKNKSDSGPPSLVGANGLQTLDDVLAKQGGANLKAQGIFNIAALQSLQTAATPADEAIKKATEETAKQTRDMATNLRRLAARPGMVFV